MNGKLGGKRSTLIVLVAVLAATMAGVLAWWRLQQPDISGVTLVGAGATFPWPQITVWAEEFKKEKGVVINYNSVGSGAGLSQLFQGTVDFACSDPPLKTADWQKNRGKVLQVPWLMGAVVITYNVPEIGNRTLKFTPEIVAKIFKGEIVYWDDPAIKQLNPELADMLPRKEIIVVHRSDSSGTTEVFTTFLHKAAPNDWPKELVGKAIEWPVDKLGRGIGGQGNQGVMAAVITNPYAIGYVEWNYAIEQGFPIAAIRNAAGRFVVPSPHSVAAAAANIKLPASPLDNFDGATFEAVYAPGDDTYPISSFTFIILWGKYEDELKALALSEFLEWVAKNGYEKVVPGYVAPPESIRALLLEAARILREG